MNTIVARWNWDTMMNVMLSYNNEGEFLYNLICKIMEKNLKMIKPQLVQLVGLWWWWFSSLDLSYKWRFLCGFDDHHCEFWSWMSHFHHWPQFWLSRCCCCSCWLEARPWPLFEQRPNHHLSGAQHRESAWFQMHILGHYLIWPAIFKLFC